VKLTITMVIAVSLAVAIPSEALAAGSYTVQRTTGASVTAGTTSLKLNCDDCSTTVSTPFPLAFYGTDYGTIGISSNGNIQFGAAAPFDGYFNDCLPSADFSEPVLMAYWDDLTTTPKTSGYGVFTKVTGTAPTRQFFVEWRAAIVSGGGNLSFEVVFSEASPTIDVIYGSGAWGQAATVGVQGSATGPQTQFACDGPGVATGVKLALTFATGGGGGTPPTVSAINNQLISPSQMTTDNLVPEQTTWVGTDPDDAIVAYEAQIRKGSKPWVDLTLASPTDTFVTANLKLGKLVNFRVRATDEAGHTGEWALGVPFTVTGMQETTPTYTGTWARTTDAGAWGGTVQRSSTAGADATITFTGRNLAMVGPKGPGYGSLDVYVDGTFWKTVKCTAPVLTERQIVFRYSTQVLTNSTHTIRIVNDGTAGHPQIDVDGFVSFKS
jgi:hypothetical protein